MCVNGEGAALQLSTFALKEWRRAVVLMKVLRSRARTASRRLSTTALRAWCQVRARIQRGGTVAKSCNKARQSAMLRSWQQAVRARMWRRQQLAKVLLRMWREAIVLLHLAGRANERTQLALAKRCLDAWKARIALLRRGMLVTGRTKARSAVCTMHSWYAWHMANVQALQSLVVYVEDVCGTPASLGGLLVMPFTHLQGRRHFATLHMLFCLWRQELLQRSESLEATCRMFLVRRHKSAAVHRWHRYAAICRAQQKYGRERVPAKAALQQWHGYAKRRIAIDSITTMLRRRVQARQAARALLDWQQWRHEFMQHRTCESHCTIAWQVHALQANMRTMSQACRWWAGVARRKSRTEIAAQRNSSSSSTSAKASLAVPIHRKPSASKHPIALDAVETQCHAADGPLASGGDRLRKSCSFRFRALPVESHQESAARAGVVQTAVSMCNNVHQPTRSRPASSSTSAIEASHTVAKQEAHAAELTATGLSGRRRGGAVAQWQRLALGNMLKVRKALPRAQLLFTAWHSAMLTSQLWQVKWMLYGMRWSRVQTGARLALARAWLGWERTLSRAPQTRRLLTDVSVGSESSPVAKEHQPNLPKEFVPNAFGSQRLAAEAETLLSLVFDKWVVMTHKSDLGVCQVQRLQALASP